VCDWLHECVLLFCFEGESRSIADSIGVRFVNCCTNPGSITSSPWGWRPTSRWVERGLLDHCSWHPWQPQDLPGEMRKQSPLRLHAHHLFSPWSNLSGSLSFTSQRSLSGGEGYRKLVLSLSPSRATHHSLGPFWVPAGGQQPWTASVGLLHYIPTDSVGEEGRLGLIPALPQANNSWQHSSPEGTAATGQPFWNHSCLCNSFVLL
jgi:hypothetical protein